MFENVKKSGSVSVYSLNKANCFVVVVLVKGKNYVVPLITDGIRMRGYIDTSYSEDEYDMLKLIVEDYIHDVYGYTYSAMYAVSGYTDPDYFKIISEVKASGIAKGPQEIIKKALEDEGYDTSSLDVVVKVARKPRDYSSLLASDEEANKIFLALKDKFSSLSYIKISEKSLLPQVKVVYEAIKTGATNLVFLIGPAGTGKSVQVEILSQLIGAPLYTKQADAGMERDDVLGSYKPVEGGFEYQRSELISAIEKGAWAVLNEGNMAMPEILCIFNQLGDDTSTITLLDGTVIKKHPNFVLFITMNLGYTGTNTLNPALKSRGMTIYLDRLTSKEFVKRMNSYTKSLYGIDLDKGLYNKLYKFGDYLQAKASDFNEDIEFCIRNAQQFVDCILSSPCSREEFISAIEISYTNKLSMDNENSKKLEDLKKDKEYKDKIEELYSLYDYNVEAEVDVADLLSSEDLLSNFKLSPDDSKAKSSGDFSLKSTVLTEEELKDLDGLDNEDLDEILDE